MSESITRDPSTEKVPPLTESDLSWRKLIAASVCLVAITFGTTYPLLFSLTFLLLPMTHQFGWTRTEFSFASTFILAFPALTMPICGWISDRIGVRPLLMFSALAVGLVSLAMAALNGDLRLFYLGYAAIGVLSGGGILYGKVVAALFTKHRGKALAVFGAESTLALATIPLITNFLIHHFGWRGVYIGFAGALFAVVPLIYFMIEEPGVVGGLPKLGQRRARRPGSLSAFAPSVLDGTAVGQALADRNFWLLILAGLVGGLIYQGLSLHMVPLLIEKGFSQTLAVTAISSIMIIGLFGSLAGGMLADHFQSAKVAAPFFAISALGALAMMTVTAPFGGAVLLFGAIGLTGVANGAQQPMATYFLTRFFGLRAFNAINGVRTAILSTMGAFSPPLVGMIYDRTHSYHLAFVLLIGGSLISAGLILMTGRFHFAANVGQAQTAAEPAPADEEPLGAANAS